MPTGVTSLKPTLLLADDHAIVIEGLRRLLQTEFDLVGAVGDGWAMQAAAVKLRPDVIVADVSMPVLNGIDALRRLKGDGSQSKVVFLSMHMDVEIAAEALRAGASAYVLKHSATDALSHAIWEALAGRTYVSPRIAQSVMASVKGRAPYGEGPSIRLTQREREVLQLVAEGRTIRGIAAILQIAVRTVVFHKCNIMDKLGARTTADLTQHAIRAGLISLEPVTADTVPNETGVRRQSVASLRR
ncbi:MAG TPA: response regulator transcription factor [Terriglobia bacterium]|nr:response regulator transcription factor [Terriglobia bacterium]